MRVKRLGNTIYGRDLGELRSGTSGDKFVSIAWVVDKEGQQERLTEVCLRNDWESESNKHLLSTSQVLGYGDKIAKELTVQCVRGSGGSKQRESQKHSTG